MLGRKTALGGAFLVGARLLSRVIDLMTMLVLARILQPRDFGLVAVASSIVSIAEVVLELPLSQALLRLPIITRSQLDTAFTLSLIRGATLGSIIVVASWPLAEIYADRRLILLACFLSLSPVLRGLGSPRMVGFQKSMSFWRDFVIESGGKLLGFATAISIALLTGDYWGLAAGTVAFPLATVAISYLFAPYLPRLSLKELPVFLSFSGWFTFAQAISAINWQFERLLLGRLVSLGQLGLFTTASDISSIPLNAILGPMIRPLLTAFAALKDEPERLRRSYQMACDAIITLGLPILVGECLLAEPMIRFVFGERWLPATPLLRLLSLSLIPGLFALPAIPLVMAFGDTKSLLRRNLTEFLVKIPLVLGGALEFGFLGVVAARLVSETVAASYCVVVVQRRLQLSAAQQVMKSWRAVIGVLVMSPVVSLSAREIGVGASSFSAGLDLLASAAIGAAIYAGSLCVLWLMAGRPHGLEAMVFNVMSRRLGSGRGMAKPVSPAG